MSVPIIRTIQLSAGINGFLKEISLNIIEGEFVCILGPNGSGKTTLLKALSGYIPHTGEIQIYGTPLQNLSANDFAKKVAIVPQEAVPEFDFSVEDIVSTGRFPHARFSFRNLLEGSGHVEEAMKLADILHLREKTVSKISTGEFQRVLLARALAQNTPVLLLDEPTAHLDVGHQVRVFELLKKLNQSEGKTILCICHDLNLAAEFAERILLLSQGCLIADGSPSAVMQQSTLRAAYGIDLLVELNSVSNRPTIRTTRLLDPAILQAPDPQ